MSSASKSFVFAAILCVVCSLLLTAASTGLKGIQQRNVAVDKQRNVLKALGLLSEQRRPNTAEIEDLYRKNIRPVRVASTGEILSEGQVDTRALPVYLYAPGDTVDAYVVPIDSGGLWGRIHGYLAIEKDGSTVRGFTVYKHQETPGLGGEIESRWFRKNFKGKKIVDQSGNFVSIAVAKGKTTDTIDQKHQANYVDGISGATLTGRFLTAGLKQVLHAYEPVAVRFRNTSRDHQPLGSVLSP